MACKQAAPKEVTANHSPMWKPQWDQRSRGQLHWVKAHLDKDQFQAKFGGNYSLWRRYLSQEADRLAGKRADQAVPPDAKQQVRQVDTLASTVSQLLSHRAEFLLTTQDKKKVFCKRTPKPPTLSKRRQVEQLAASSRRLNRCMKG